MMIRKELMFCALVGLTMIKVKMYSIEAFLKIWKNNLNISLKLIGEYSRNTIKYGLANNSTINKKFQKTF